MTRRARIAVAIVALAAAAPFVVTVEPPAPSGGWHVNVRWAPSVGESERIALERTHELVLLERQSERTWIYRLGDPSRAAIRALVTDPLVEDTHGIDRDRFRISEPRVTLARRLRTAYEDDDLPEWVAPRTLAALCVAAALLAAVRRRRVAAALTRGIPDLSAAGLGLYRLALAAALAAVVVQYADLPGTAFPRELHRSHDWFANWEWVHSLASRPDLEQWSTPLMLALLAAFGSGLFARTAFAAFVLVLTAHVLVVLQHKSAHDWGLPLVVLWGLVVVPWHEGIGIDMLRRRAPRGAGNYGFAVWMPGLLVGLAFAAAAFAKLDTSGLGWITGGAVKYHFIEDARQAQTDLGLRIAANEPLAVGLSAAAIAVESLFILHVFFRSPWIRAAFAVPALAMLIGFRVLQGIIWAQWWVPFLCFVPWNGIATRLALPCAASAAAPRVPRLGVALAVLLAVVQVMASGLRVEHEPFVSDYAMYAWTWTSRDAFDEYIARKYRRYAYLDDRAGVDLTPRIANLSKASDTMADAVDTLRAGESLSDGRRQALAAVTSAYADAYGHPLHRVLVRVDEQAFDWTSGRFRQTLASHPLGTLDLASGVLRPAGAGPQ